MEWNEGVVLLFLLSMCSSENAIELRVKYPAIVLAGPSNNAFVVQDKVSRIY